MSATNWAIFLNGSYGVGKSSTLDHIGDLMFASGQPFTLMDVDWFHRSWPPADHDHGNKIIEAQNMAAAWVNFQTAGPRQLIISGVIATAEDLQRYSTALGVAIRPVRLVATDQTTERRLRGRYSASQTAAHQWHIDRYQQLNRQLAEADLDELVIQTDALAPDTVARAVLIHYGLLPH